jgi:hypothetical protein
MSPRKAPSVKVRVRIAKTGPFLPHISVVSPEGLELQGVPNFSSGAGKRPRGEFQHATSLEVHAGHAVRRQVIAGLYNPSPGVQVGHIDRERHPYRVHSLARVDPQTSSRGESLRGSAEQAFQPRPAGVRNLYVRGNNGVLGNVAGAPDLHPFFCFLSRTTKTPRMSTNTTAATTLITVTESIALLLVD